MSDREYKIIAATLPCEGKPGVEPKWRFVIVAWFYPDGKLREYSTHVDILEGGAGPGLHNGHYTQRWEDVLKEFAERVGEHNKYYKEGNVSHIPGIDFLGCGCNPSPAREREGGIQERAESQRRKLTPSGKGLYIEGS